MNKVQPRMRALLAKCAVMITCALASGSSAQTTPPNRGVLLRPQTGTLLQSVGACTVNQLNLRISTGSDDLRGGNNNLNVEIHFANGDMQPVANVNKGSNWPNHSVNTVVINLNHPVAPNEIRQIRLVHSAQAGYNPPSARQASASTMPVAGPMLAPIYAAQRIQSEDNWDMTEFQAFALGQGVNVPVASAGFHRFTGSNPSFDIKAQPGIGCPSGKQVRSISFTFSTADDDLRGGKDDLNITILFTDGTNQAATNVNHSQNWPNGSTKGAEVLLNRLVTMAQIRGFTLEDTFTGGSGGDNWNMASVEADAVLADGTYHTIAKSGFHRFSADWNGPKAKQITISAHPIN